MAVICELPTFETPQEDKDRTMDGWRLESALAGLVLVVILAGFAIQLSAGMNRRSKCTKPFTI